MPQALPLLISMAISLAIGEVERALKPHGTRERIAMGVVGQAANGADGEFFEVVSYRRCWWISHRK